MHLSLLLALLLPDPSFIHVQLIPDSAERNDDKLYFFFREKSAEMGQSPVTQARIGRICLVSTASEWIVLIMRPHSQITMHVTCTANIPQFH